MRDLYPGLGFDPTPGEPADVAAVLATLSDGANAVSEVSSMLDRAVRPGGWRGPAASAFRAGTAALPGVLDEVADRVVRAREALTSWQDVLSANKRAADQLDRTARGLRDQPEALARVLDQAHRLRARHLRQATAAAYAIRALTGVVVPPDAWGTGTAVVAGTSAQVSTWTGEVATLPWPTTVAAAAPGAVATLPTAPSSIPAPATGAPPTPVATLPVAAAPVRPLPLTRLPLDTPPTPYRPVVPVAGPPTRQPTAPATRQPAPRPATRRAAPPTRTSSAAPVRERSAEPTHERVRHQELRAAGSNPGSPSPAGNPTGGPVPPRHEGGRPGPAASTHSAGNSPVRATPSGNAAPISAPSATSAGHAAPSTPSPIPNSGSAALTGAIPTSSPSPGLTPITGAGPTSSGAGSTAFANPTPGANTSHGSAAGPGPNTSGNAGSNPGTGSSPNSNSNSGTNPGTGSNTSGNPGSNPGSNSNPNSGSAQNNSANPGTAGQPTNPNSSPGQPTSPNATDPENPETETDLGLTAMALGAAAGCTTQGGATARPGRLAGFLLHHPTDRPILTFILVRHTADGRVHRHQLFVPCAPLASPRNPAIPAAAEPDLLTTSERNSNG